MAWTTPERLFICLSKFEPEHGQRLLKTYTAGASPPPEIEAIRREHLRYVYELGEKGISFAGGALGEFQGTLSIYAVNSLEEAKKARQNDPYYRKGMLYGDKYYEWFVHMPLGKASPAHRDKVERGLIKAGIIVRGAESKVEWTTPERLFVCLCKVAPTHAEGINRVFAGGPPLSPKVEAVRLEHLRYMYDLGQRGILWAGGALGDFSSTLNIYAVNSLEEAKKAHQNDPYYPKGTWYDDEYYQWFIHMPLSRAVPERREKLRQALVNFGILPG